MKVWVLRLGHRRGRDPRLTTHVALTARALGCDGIILSGEKDGSIMENINEVVKDWGNRFEVKYGKIDTKGILKFMHKFKINKGYIISSRIKKKISTNDKTIYVIPAYKYLLDSDHKT